MHWVYLLKLEGDRYYVGETTRLYTRLNEHSNPNRYSSNHCLNYEPDCLLGIYDVRKDEIYRQYSKILNNITYDNENNYDSLDDILVSLPKEYSKLCCFKEDAVLLENNITLHKMKLLGDNWHRVRGGKYCQEYINNNPSVDYKYKRPCCNCHMKIPAEINIYNNKLYFRCVKKSMDWIDMDNFKHNIDIIDNTPCNFYREVNEKCNYFNN